MSSHPMSTQITYFVTFGFLKNFNHFIYDMVQTFLEPVLSFKLACEIQFSVFREHSFFTRGGGQEEFRRGSLTFCLLKKGGSA